jgi:hypothetical protein
MKKILIITALFILFCACTTKEKKPNKTLIESYSDGNPKIEYTIYEGNIKNLVKVYYTAYYDNGNLMKEGMIINNKENGLWKYYFYNGKISGMGKYVSGKRMGKAVQFYESGEIEQIMEYVDNKITNINFYYRNGKQKSPKVNVAHLIKDKAKEWSLGELKKTKDRCFYQLWENNKNPMGYCDCMIDAVSQYVDFASLDTLSDFERGYLYGLLNDKANCFEKFNISLKSQMDTTYIKNIHLYKNYDLNFIKKLNPAWMNYYHIDLVKFKLDTCWSVTELMDGNIRGDFNSGFNKNHIPFLINSPDNKQYIDLDYYTFQIEKNSKNKLVLTGGEVDQEVNLVNRETKKIKRLAFFGPTSSIEDAKWINNEELVLFGVNKDKSKLFLEIINIKTLNFNFYSCSYDQKSKKDFAHDIRLKKMKFENIE